MDEEADDDDADDIRTGREEEGEGEEEGQGGAGVVGGGEQPTAVQPCRGGKSLKPRAGPTSKFKGVSKSKGKGKQMWGVQISFSAKERLHIQQLNLAVKQWVGSFDTEIGAARAFNVMARRVGRHDASQLNDVSDESTAEDCNTSAAAGDDVSEEESGEGGESDDDEMKEEESGDDEEEASGDDEEEASGEDEEEEGNVPGYPMGRQAEKKEEEESGDDEASEEEEEEEQDSETDEEVRGMPPTPSTKNPKP